MADKYSTELENAKNKCDDLKTFIQKGVNVDASKEEIKLAASISEDYKNALITYFDLLMKSLATLGTSSEELRTIASNLEKGIEAALTVRPQTPSKGTSP